jgi:integrase
LNTTTRSILDKYKKVEFPGNKALPVIQNQPMNRDVKELCRLAEINEEIRVTTYKGNVRKDEIHPKWELVGTHTGRRTFIVTALSKGISPNIVMKWTGHKDYSAMKPYIDIMDPEKVEAMKVFDEM